MNSRNLDRGAYCVYVTLETQTSPTKTGMGFPNDGLETKVDVNLEMLNCLDALSD